MRCLLIIFFNVHFAAASQDYQQEIIDQVWKPFIRASSEFDGEGFMAVQSKDLVRFGLDGNTIHGLDAYAKSILPGFKRLKEEGKVTRTTEVRFTKRITSAEFSYEAGYFKSTTKMADGTMRERFTRFYFIMRKETEGWKILVDSDSSGADVTEEMFQQAKPMSPEPER